MEAALAAARAFAVNAHGDQKRKDGKTPYWTHLDGVVRILRENGVSNPVTLEAAYLHDTLEDTDVTYEDLVREFGVSCAELVKECTRDPSTHRDVYSNHFRTASAGACLIKLADRLYNLQDWKGMERGYRPNYSAEGMEIVTRILRNDKTRRRWTTEEHHCARILMTKLTAIFLVENRFKESELTSAMDEDLILMEALDGAVPQA